MSPLAVLLAGYIALGAPLARYIPSLQELVYVAPKEVPLTQAQLERMEREALRKEQEEDFEKATMDGVVRAPSAFGITTGSPASRTDTTELVVPRSMPTAFAMVMTPLVCAVVGGTRAGVLSE